MPAIERLRELASAAEPRLQLMAPFILLPGPGVTELLLIRHAQVPGGSMSEDSSLTDLGREQAEALADYLTDVRIDAVYSSPSSRAQETAAFVATRHGLSVGVIDGLRDVDNRMPHGLSPLEALTREFGEAEAQRRFDEVVREGWSFDAFGDLMESSRSIRLRVASAIDDVVAKHSGGRVALLSHGPPIAAYISQVLGSPGDFVFYPRLTSISVVLAKESQRRVHLLNATPHFAVL
jgi:broad specificity phosphatase PhoE